MANDVIEHVVDTKNFISLMHQKLSRNGVLVLSVPNIRQIRTGYYIYIRGVFPRNKSGLFDETHLRWFCKRDIVSLTEKIFDVRSCVASGRVVPRILEKTLLGELLGLHNLFVLEKKESWK